MIIKTLYRTQCYKTRIESISILSIMFGLIFFGGDLFSQEVGDEGNEDQPKDHFLFVGMNLKVLDGDEYLTMENYDNYFAEILRDGTKEKISIGHVKSFRVEKQMKVSRHQVHVSEFESKSVFSLAADPTLKGLRDMAGASDVAAVRLSNRDSAARLVSVANAVTPGDTPVFDIDTSSLELAISQTSFTPFETSVGTQGSEHLGGGMHDAIRISFSVSSTDNINQPYVLVVAKIKQSPNDESIVSWIHIEEISEITEKSKKVSIYENGFPPGYEIEECEIYLFSGEEELATNFAEKKISLTKQDAYQYLLFQYMNDNFGKDVQSAPVWSGLPLSVGSTITDEQMAYPMTFYINAEGIVTNIKSKKLPMKTLEQGLKKSLVELSFYPALKEGEPVDGEFTATLADFLL